MFMNTCSRYRRFVEQTRQPVAVADCPEGRLTDTRSPLYREMRELVASISRDVAEGFSLEAGAARSRT